MVGCHGIEIMYAKERKNYGLLEKSFYNVNN